MHCRFLPGGPGSRTEPGRNSVRQATGPASPLDPLDRPGPAHRHDVDAGLVRWPGGSVAGDARPPLAQRRVAPRGRPQETLDQVVGTDRAAQVFRTQSGPFFQILGVGPGLFFGAAVCGCGSPPTERPARSASVQYVALGAASFPVASFLANLARWWRSDRARNPVVDHASGDHRPGHGSRLARPVAAADPRPTGVVPAYRGRCSPSTCPLGQISSTRACWACHRCTMGGLGFGNIPYAIFVASALVAAAALAQFLLDRGASAVQRRAPRRWSGWPR